MANYRTKTLGLMNQVVSVYDKTKTYIKGHVSQKTLGGVPCLGAGETQIVDPFTDTGGAFIGGNIFVSPNGRLFELSTSASGFLTVVLYNFDLSTGVRGSIVGRIQLNMPNAAATVHTVRAFSVMDTGTTGWTIGLGTIGNVLVNGGVFMVWNVALADFTSSPTVFGMGIASNQKAVYFQQDTAGLGAANVITSISGGDFDLTTGIFYVETGLVGAMSFYGFDMTVTPTITTQTTTSATVNTSPTFTLTAHGYALNDQVVLLSNVPTAFTGSTATVQTVYFINNPTANTFELKATTAGASINNTSVTSATVFARAHGQTTAGFLSSKKTGIVTGFTGTILLTNSHNICTPVTGHPNAGFPCLFVSSSSNGHLFKLSDITAGATSFPSLATINILGGATDITAPTAVQARYLDTIGKLIYTTSICSLVMKDWVNNAIIATCGGQDNTWYENVGLYTSHIGFISLAAMESKGGWLFLMGSTAGQRVTIILDLYSTATLGLSYITTPVIPTDGYTFKALGAYRQNVDITVPSLRQYKTAATFADAIFNTPDTGWITVPNDMDESGLTLLAYSQFKLLSRIVEKEPPSPSQISEVLLTYSFKYDNSENWVSDEELSTQSATSPSYSVSMLSLAYQTSVPKITMYAISKATGLIVRQKDTINNPTEFTYSTNNGGTWTALGTVPNTLYTRLRYSWGIALPEDCFIVWSDL